MQWNSPYKKQSAPQSGTSRSNTPQLTSHSDTPQGSANEYGEDFALNAQALRRSLSTLEEAEKVLGEARRSGLLTEDEEEADGYSLSSVSPNRGSQQYAVSPSQTSAIHNAIANSPPESNVTAQSPSRPTWWTRCWQWTMGLFSHIAVYFGARRFVWTDCADTHNPEHLPQLTHAVAQQYAALRLSVQKKPIAASFQDVKAKFIHFLEGYIRLKTRWIEAEYCHSCGHSLDVAVAGRKTERGFLGYWFLGVSHREKQYAAQQLKSWVQKAVTAAAVCQYYDKSQLPPDRENGGPEVHQVCATPPIAPALSQGRLGQVMGLLYALKKKEDQDSRRSVKPPITNDSVKSNCRNAL